MRTILVLLLTIPLTTARAAAQGAFVMPRGLESLDGDLIRDGQDTAAEWSDPQFRRQLIYDASNFGWPATGARTISKLTFRRDGSVAIRFREHQKRTRITIGGLDGSLQSVSTTFASNIVGGTEIFSLSQVDFPDRDLPPTEQGNARPMSVFVPTAPFVLDPAAPGIVIDIEVVENGVFGLGWYPDTAADGTFDPGGFTRLGPGCAPDGLMPGGGMRDVFIGSTFARAWLTTLYLDTPALWWIGPVRDQPIRLPDGCTLFVDPWEIVAGNTNGFSGEVDFRLGRVPDLPNLAGCVFGVQAGLMDSAMPQGISLSSGFAARIGSGPGQPVRFVQVYANDADASAGTILPHAPVVGIER